MSRKTDPYTRVNKALHSFTKALDELRIAAEDHHAIADEANAQVNELNMVSAKNRSAAFDAERRASKIAEFLA